MLYKRCSLLVDITNQLLSHIIHCLLHQQCTQSSFLHQTLHFQMQGKMGLRSLCPAAGPALSMVAVPRKGASARPSQRTYLLESHKLILGLSAFVDLIFIPGTERGTGLDSDISEFKKRQGSQALMWNLLPQRRDQPHRA